MRRKKPITVNVFVTRGDIEHGKRGSCFSCPVALAIRRQFPDADSVAVSHSGAYVWASPGAKRLTARLPEKVLRFIGVFDATRSRSEFKKKFKPMRFVLSFAPEV